MKTTRYGIIGCGMMGQEHLRNLKLLPEVCVSAIFEPDETMARYAAELAPEAQMVNSLDALLSHPELDALIIASPNHVHAEQLERIGAVRPLPTLVEKPLFTDPSQRAIVEPWLEHSGFAPGAPIWVAMEYRYMPPVALLRERLQAVTGGLRMLSIREHRFPFLEKVNDWNRFNRGSGGTFVEKCCHFFDLMRLLSGAEAVRVQSSIGQAVNHIDERYDGKAPDIDDHGYVIVDFDNGVRAMLELCMFAEGEPYQEHISAIGPAGKIECLVPGPGRFWPDELGPAPIAKLIESPRNPAGRREIEVPVDPVLLAAGDHNGSTFYQHQGFLELVRGERSRPDVSLEDGLRAVDIGMAAQGFSTTQDLFRA